MTKNTKKIAIVYDWIDKWGGVERVLLTLHEMFPQAKFFTSFVDFSKAGWARNLEIYTSFVQRFPDLIRSNRILSLPFYPYVFESFDFSDFDTVISVTSSFAKSVLTKPGTVHVCYLLTPTRYLWVMPNRYFSNPLSKLISSFFLGKLRQWDFISAQRPDKIVSISKTVADRCRKYYQRNSEVIYPPFDTSYWNIIKSKLQNPRDKSNPNIKFLNGRKFFLTVSRLELYKKIDLVIRSFHQLENENLVVVGEGSQRKSLERIAGKNVTFFSKLSDEELGWLYANAEGFILPQEEDFGYTSLEAQFFGCPVIAYQRGGAVETVIEGKTGIFFQNQEEASLIAGLKRYDMLKYSLRTKAKESGPKNVENYRKEDFKRKFLQSII